MGGVLVATYRHVYVHRLTSEVVSVGQCPSNLGALPGGIEHPLLET